MFAMAMGNRHCHTAFLREKQSQIISIVQIALSYFLLMTTQYASDSIIDFSALIVLKDLASRRR